MPRRGKLWPGRHRRASSPPPSSSRVPRTACWPQRAVGPLSATLRSRRSSNNSAIGLRECSERPRLARSRKIPLAYSLILQVRGGVHSTARLMHIDGKAPIPSIMLATQPRQQRIPIEADMHACPF